MKPGNHERIPTVSEAVKEAAAITDPDGADGAIMALYEIYEDDDRPTTALEDIEGELFSTARGIDPEGDDGPLLATAAAATWLATNPDQAHAGDHVLREGTRLAFKGDPPAQVSAWLESRGVEV
jgi:hypothetical protein